MMSVLAVRARIWCVGIVVLSLNWAHGGLIVEYDLAGELGTQEFTAPTSVAANVTGLNLTRGSGLIASAGSTSGGNTFSSAGWHDLSPTDYVSFGFIVQPGYRATLDQLQFRSRSDESGPREIGLFYSGDGFSQSLSTFTHPTNTVISWQTDLTALTDLEGSVEFRFYALNNQSTSLGTIQSHGTFRVANYLDGRTEYPFSVSGSVAAIPEPSTILLTLMAAGAFGGVRVARRFRLRRG